jgi:acyl-CoA thioester hydrolase
MTTKDPTKKTDFEWRLRVYYEDTDAGGIVYYANYLRFFERARTEWLRAKGISSSELAQNDGLQFVVSSLSIDYKFPAKLDDELTLSLRNLRTRRASIDLEQEAHVTGSDHLLAGARIKIACIRCNDGNPAAMPDWLVKRVTE